MAVAAGTFTGCNDFLDDNRYPQTSEINEPAFWSNPDNVDQECALLFNIIKGYGAYYASVTSTSNISEGDFYFTALSDDQCARNGVGQQWLNTTIPSSAGTYTNPYYNIRQCMYIWNGVEQSSLTEDQKNNYIGIARLNRAIQTFELVKRYGDVIWVDKLLDPADMDVLMGERMNRDLVMDKVLEDLDFAIANITAQSDKLGWSKDMAMAAKAEICLYEGTYCKYRTVAENGAGPDINRANNYFKECVKACEPLMNTYSLDPTYLETYNTYDLGKFTSNPNIIFGKAYKMTVIGHGTIAYTTSGTTINGISKDAFDAFLFRDGKPLALTTLDKSDAGKMVDGLYYIGDALAVRDARLSSITDAYAYCENMRYSRAGSDPMASSTGYGVRKFDNETLPIYNRSTIGQGPTCAPIYYLSAVLCEFAEAKAELGDMSQDDIDKSINKLYARAELPDLKLPVFHDPANTIGVSDIVWEARRCRRCELMMDRDFRYWDLVRWHQLDKLDNTNVANQATWLGANMVNASVYVDNLAAAGTVFEEIDGGVYLSAKLAERKWEPRQYFFPIPSAQLTLNEKLGQNPGWK